MNNKPISTEAKKILKPEWDKTQAWIKEMDEKVYKTRMTSKETGVTSTPWKR